jgi:hypothetical protein
MYKKTRDSPQKNLVQRAKGIGGKKKWNPMGTNPGGGPVTYPSKKIFCFKTLNMVS